MKKLFVLFLMLVMCFPIYVFGATETFNDGLIDILTKIPIIYYIIGGSVFVLIIAILVIVVIKNKNVIKVEEGIIANNEVSSNVVEDNVIPSETISQEQSDNNETQL